MGRLVHATRARQRHLPVAADKVILRNRQRRSDCHQHAFVALQVTLCRFRQRHASRGHAAATAAHGDRYASQFSQRAVARHRAVVVFDNRARHAHHITGVDIDRWRTAVVDVDALRCRRVTVRVSIFFLDKETAQVAARLEIADHNPFNRVRVADFRAGYPAALNGVNRGCRSATGATVIGRTRCRSHLCVRCRIERPTRPVGTATVRVVFPVVEFILVDLLLSRCQDVDQTGIVVIIGVVDQRILQVGRRHRRVVGKLCGITLVEGNGIGSVLQAIVGEDEVDVGHRAVAQHEVTLRIGRLAVEIVGGIRFVVIAVEERR